MKNLLTLTDDWQPHQTAPKDGTPVLISGSGLIGVFYWEDRDGQLWDSHFGKTMPACWRGIHFLTDLNPMVEHKADGSTVPSEARFVQVDGLDRPFYWKPLPAQYDEAKKGDSHGY